MPRGASAGSIALAVAVLAGCGDGASRLTPVEQNRLLEQVDRARESVLAGDLDTTRLALGVLKHRIAQLEAQGEISAGAAQELRAEADAASRGAGLALGRRPAEDQPRPATPAAAVQPAAAAARVKDGHAEGED